MGTSMRCLGGTESRMLSRGCSVEHNSVEHNDENPARTAAQNGPRSCKANVVTPPLGSVDQ